MPPLPTLQHRPRPPKFQRVGRARKSGFSLVEVVLSIGIIAFAFVALLGLLPAGMGIFGSAMDTSVRTQIVQRIISDSQQTDFDILKVQPPTTKYFDDEGTEVAQATSIYTVAVTVKPTTALPKTTTSSNLITLKVQIAKNPAHVPDPFSPPGNYRAGTYSAFIARNK